jgi:hypothetical protein
MDKKHIFNVKCVSLVGFDPFSRKIINYKKLLEIGKVYKAYNMKSFSKIHRDNFYCIKGFDLCNMHILKSVFEKN